MFPQSATWVVLIYSSKFSLLSHSISHLSSVSSQPDAVSQRYPNYTIHTHLGIRLWSSYCQYLCVNCLYLWSHARQPIWLSHTNGGSAILWPCPFALGVSQPLISSPGRVVILIMQNFRQENNKNVLSDFLVPTTSTDTLLPCIVTCSAWIQVMFVM